MTVIYALLDEAGQRRYVGKSACVEQRFRDHLKRGKPWAAAYEVLEKCGELEWAERERFWISHGRSCGWPLENLTEGGDGWDGSTHTAATRQKISEKLRGRPKTPEHCKAVSLSLLGHQVPEDVRLKISGSVKRNHPRLPRGAECRAKIGDALRGRSNWHKGRKRTAETRAAMSSALRKWWKVRSEFVGGFDTTPAGYVYL